jgi:SpoVK/Ycf46/Vps4 family AAA+-type ATPase
MRRRHPSLHHAPAQDRCALDPIVLLWMLRILVPMGGLRRLVHDACGMPPDVQMRFGMDLDDIDDTATLELQIRQASIPLKKLHARAERDAHNAKLPDALVANIARLASLVQLSPTECRIVEFACMLHTLSELDDMADALGQLTTAKAQEALEQLLHLPGTEVKAALSPQGQLARCGLLTVCGHRDTLKSKLDLLSGHFADSLLVPDVEPMSLLQGILTPSRPASLQLEDYPHLGLNLQMLQSYLIEAHAQHRPAVNILLYGPPGTGKTELSRTLAQTLGCTLYEISTEDDDGDPIDGVARLRAYRAAQRFLERRSVMILFDEIEDVFQSEHTPLQFSDSFRRTSGRERKGWMNKTLEANPVPTFWLTNAIGRLDAAFIRRFDFALELPVPPQRVREKIAATCVGELADASTLQALASSHEMAPAVLTRAASVLQTIEHRLPEGQASTALLQLVNNTLQAQGHPPVKALDPNRLPETYDPAFIHADADLAALADGIAQAGSARLCLYGPPGTGKTAYARWLAQRLGRPLLVKRASDLLSMWLGESEKHIAEAFREAQTARAVLLIDEVDSFLQERRGATHSWEVTQVNEMLTQMEAYDGVFIATTNLMDGLDPAALRRFDLKAKFDYLRPQQAQALLLAHCRQLGMDCSHEARRAVARLPSLTPGDFAAVTRRHRFGPLPDAAALVRALADECGLKDAPKAVLGFV